MQGWVQLAIFPSLQKSFSKKREVLIRCLISNFMNEDRGPFNVTLVSSNVNLQAKQLESITNFFSHNVK